ncbi:1-phosphofructokinase family hexose kinase [Enterococcus sp. AZ192]|uniref:1-phosphofructokinase family hexose kinase n=1 Tax=unclassified Enterococcus TaxID=2608891 RepID=UPI003D2D0D4E
MILTVTLNPSLDSIYFTDTFILGEMNRCGNPVKVVGGKGINAGRTAAILGAEVTAVGVLAGINGEFIRSCLEQEPFFATHFFPIAGESRNAVTIMDQENNQTEIVELGPEISEETSQRVLDLVITFIKKQKKEPIIAFCGSANTKNEHLYEHYLQQLSADTKILADISGQQLQNVLEGSAKPYFIKPNIHEFGDLLGVTLQNKQDVFSYLDHSLLKSVPFILVSCGREGAVAKFHERLFDIQIPKIETINPTGSGDATVGGIAFALDQGLSIEETLKYGMACGMSNALEQAVGYVTKENVARLKKKIILHEIQRN